MIPINRRKAFLIFSGLTIIIFFNLYVFCLNSYKIDSWQVRNDRIEFIPDGYFVPYLSYFEEFNEGRIFSISTYRKALIKAVTRQGIEVGSIKKAMAIADLELEKASKVPIMIETARFKNQNAIILTYQLEFSRIPQLSYLKGKFSRRHHHFLGVVVSEDTGKVLLSAY